LDYRARVGSVGAGKNDGKFLAADTSNMVVVAYRVAYGLGHRCKHPTPYRMSPVSFTALK
ncbi:MAG TPA: hypothetical protein VN808_14715, partial [Stellaceae bacterium]|nr:hypothetical protein [Stellaceae bacterium]